MRNLLDFTKGTSKLFNLLVIGIMVVLTTFLVHNSTQTTEQQIETTNPPIPIITCKEGFATSVGGKFCYLINVTIYNSGGAGLAMVGARVIYEFSGYTQETFANVFLDSNRSTNVMLILIGIPATSCGNTHVIRYQIWCILP